uniref:Uncharacterized protein n=1 Tax=Physcomitrium patens TaxID=3218 RepID=A0A2K1K2A7_PHYPA|nr:hypothetical protein PHYPA_012376 [Physcomitrium patens]
MDLAVELGNGVSRAFEALTLAFIL